MTAPFRTLLFAISLASALGSSFLASPAEDLTAEGAAEIAIAVRTDARPFIWKDPDTGEYLGFFWDICTEAVQRAGYRFRVEEVEPARRKEFLLTGATNYDLLCDPTTITLKRLQHFAGKSGVSHLEFSPIIFVSNGTYIQQERGANQPKARGTLPEDAPPQVSCVELLNWLDRDDWPPNAENSPPPWNNQTERPNTEENQDNNWFAQLPFTFRKQQEPATRTYEIWGFVKGSTIGEAVTASVGAESDKTSVVCLRGLDSHILAAADFCAGRLYRYFGDADIVRAALEERRRMGETCAADLTAIAAGTYEPYAFVVSQRTFPDFPERLTLALYGMFEDLTIERLFAAHFKTQKSQYLDTLFRINRIPAGTGTPSK